VKVFLDTNVLVSAHTARGLSADLFRLVVAEHVLLVGEVVLEELRRVLRDRFRVPAGLVTQIERDLRLETVVPKPHAASDLPIRDRDDAWILASAVSGGADLLVSDDHDLLAVAEQSPLPILAPRHAWERLRASK
jgi:putative PIN family toxin of toxin-antitoxin system